MLKHREKLIDLRREGEEIAENFCVSKQECYQCPYNAPNGCKEGLIADHLIGNGVTIQKWIPVTERLPERDGKYLCNYHFGEHRNMTFTQVLDYYATDKAPHFQHEGNLGMKVSHWMPLPEAPKGE